MLGTGIPLGRLFGIRIRLHFSWFIIFALLTWILTTSHFPERWGFEFQTALVISLVTSLLVFSCILAHELAHSLVAKALGIPVPSIVLFILGGVSEMTAEPKKPRAEFWLAIAGPATSLCLGLLFWGIWTLTQDTSEHVAAVAELVSGVNILVAVFNMIPGFPMDGGRVLRSILWWRTGNLRSATQTASIVGRGIGYLFILGGIVLIFSHHLLNGLWMIFLGWFIQNLAAGSYREVAMRDKLHGHTVSEAMTHECIVVTPEVTIEQLVTDYILRFGHRCFPVEKEGHLVGLVTLHDVKAVPHEIRTSAVVEEIMVPLHALKWVRPDEDLSHAMQLLIDGDINQLPVMEDGTVVGMIGRDNVLSFLKSQADLEDQLSLKKPPQ